MFHGQVRIGHQSGGRPRVLFNLFYRMEKKVESISDILTKAYFPVFKPFLDELLEKYKRYLLRKPDDFITTNLKELIRLVGLLRTDNRDNIVKMMEFGFTALNHLVLFLFIYLGNSELLTRIIEKHFDYLRILEIIEPNQKPKEDFYFSNFIEIMKTVPTFPKVEKYFDKDLRNAIAHFDWGFDFGDPIIIRGKKDILNPYVSYSENHKKKLFVLNLPNTQPSLYDVVLGNLAFAKFFVGELQMEK